MTELKITKLTMFDGMELKEATFSNLTFPDHFHDSYSIAIIEQGTEKLCYGKKELIGHAHAVLVANPYEIHAHGFFDNDACRYKAVYIPIELMKHIQHRYGLHGYKTVWFPQQVFDDIHLFRKIQSFHNMPNDAKAQSLYDIGRYMIAHYSIDKPEPSFTPLAAITDAAYYLQQLPYDLNMQAAAQQYGMDKFKFIRTFKKQTGLTPVSYLLLHRIDKAKKLIATNMPLVEVALETGFYDQSHFIHYFKKYVGISPLEYRKCIRTPA